MQILFNDSQRCSEWLKLYFTAWINCSLLDKVFYWPRKTALYDKQSVNFDKAKTAWQEI